MTALATLRALQVRVRAAEGPDRELAGDLNEAFFADVGEAFALIGSRTIPDFTTSIDAVVALIGKVLPGWAWSCGSCSVTHDATVCQRAWFAPDIAGPDAALLMDRKFDEGFDGDRRDGNPALALLAAMLSGLIAKAEASS